MKLKSKLLALTTVTLMALTPITANAMSDGVFSWPTDYRSKNISEATSTYDGKTNKLEIKKPAVDKTKKTKRN